MPNFNHEIIAPKLNDLVKLGLTATQARVYIVLLTLGPSGARTISGVAGLPREDTYRMLRELRASGLVEVIMAKPSIFTAIDPKVAMSLLVSRLYNKFVLLKKTAMETGEWLHSLNRTDSPTEPFENRSVFKLEGGEQVFERMSKLVQNCKNELVRILSATGLRQNYLLGIFDQESKIVDRGVRVRAITELLPVNREILEEYSKFVELRHLVGVDSSLKYCIVDDSEMILLTSSPTNNIRDMGAIWTNNRPWIQGFKKEFELTWSGATPMSSILSDSLLEKQVGGKNPHHHNL